MVKFVSQPLELYNTGTADALYLESSDAGSSAGPVITLKRNSPSPASADYIGQLKFKGESSSGVDRVYAKITAKIDDPTNAAEDGIIEFTNRFNGAEQIALRLKLDSFRILNNVDLFVDGGNTGLGQVSASERLDVNGNIAVSGTVDGRDVGTDGTNQDALQTLTGVSAAATNLGTFTGTTIADNVTVKDALQDLEDAAIPSGGASGTILAKASSADYDTEWIAQTAAISSVSQDTSPALGGNLDGSSNDISGVNAYSGASLSLTGNITVGGTVDGRDVATDGTNQDAIQTLTGIAAGTANLGTFTGTTIPDSQTIKGALQSLETALDAKAPTDTPSFTGVVSSAGQIEIPRGVSYGTNHLGTFYPLVGLGSANQRIFGDLAGNTGKRYQITGSGDLEMMTNARSIIFRNGALNVETLRLLSDGTLQPVNGVPDLGASGNKFNDLWLGGAAHLEEAYVEDTLEVGGTLQTRPAGDGLVDVGASSRKFRDGYFAGSLFVGGAVETDETLQPGAGVADADLGSSSRKWRDLWISRDIYVDGNIESTGNVQPRAGATTADLGSSSRKWRNLLMSGNITVDGTVDGRDVAADGAKLDGIEPNATADLTANEIRSLLVTVDGTGSGLDADLLDGVQGSNYARQDSANTFLSSNTFNSTVSIGGVLQATGEHDKTEIKNWSVLPTGYEYEGINFMMDQSQTAWLLSDTQTGASYSVTVGTDPGSAAMNRLFDWTNNYSNLNSYKDASSNFEFEVTGFTLSNSSNTNWKPYILWHAGAGAVGNVVIHGLEGDGTTWTELYDGPSKSPLWLKDYTVFSTGNLKGLRFRFENITGNAYLKMVGAMSRTSDGFAWQMLKSGGDFHGDVYHRNIFTRQNATYDIGKSGTRFRGLYLSSVADIQGQVTAGHVAPQVHDTYSLGSGGNRWRELYLSNQAQIDGVLGVTGNSTLGHIRAQTHNTYSIGTNSVRFASLYLAGNINVDGTVDGRDIATDGAKLDGIEPNATADQTAADIRALGFFDTTNDGTGSGLDADTVDGVEASAFLLADGTRSMSGSLDMGGNAIVDATSISGATLVQASTVRTDSLRPISGTTTADIGGGGEPFRNLTLSGNLTITGTVDGRDVATDGTNQDALQTLTGIAAGTSNLGTFTGSTIADSSTIKAALQALETKAEASIGASSVSYSTLEAIYDGATEVGTALDNLANGLGSLATKSTITSSDITDGTITGADIGTAEVGLNNIIQIGPETILGNSSTFANGSPSALSATAVKTILSIANTDVSGLGTLSTINDAPSDGTQYARQNGAWAAVTAAATTGSPAYMKRTGTGTFLVTSTPASPSWGTLVSQNLPGGEITFSSGVFTVVDAGQYRFGAYLTVNSTLQRAQVAAEVYIDGVAVGDQRGGAYVRNAGASYDYWTVEVAPEIHDLTAGQTIEIRIGQVNGSTFGYSGTYTINCHEDKSRCWIERIAAGQKGDPGPAGDALAGFNQTLTGTRTIDDGDNGYSLFIDLNNGGASTAQVLVNPSTPTVTMAANAGSAATTSLIQLNGSTMNLQFGASAGLTVNAAAGSDGQALVTSGAGAPPEWGGYTVHRGTSAPTNTNMLWYNTTEEELFTYDSGRGHWFGAPYYISMGKTTSTTAGTGHFLYVGHQGTTATTSERGWLVPHDMTITGIRGHTQSTFDGWTFRVDKNSGGTNTSGVVSTGALGAVDTYSDFTLDVDLAAADIIGMAGVLGSVTINNSTFIIEVRRRL